MPSLRKALMAQCSSQATAARATEMPADTTICLLDLHRHTDSRPRRRHWTTCRETTCHSDYRLELASTLLSEGKMNVSEAGDAVGFNSSSYFSKAYKKKYGFLPSEKPQQQKFFGFGVYLMEFYAYLCGGHFLHGKCPMKFQ